MAKNPLFAVIWLVCKFSSLVIKSLNIDIFIGACILLYVIASNSISYHYPTYYSIVLLGLAYCWCLCCYLDFPSGKMCWCIPYSIYIIAQYKYLIFFLSFLLSHLKDVSVLSRTSLESLCLCCFIYEFVCSIWSLGDLFALFDCRLCKLHVLT